MVNKNRLIFENGQLLRQSQKDSKVFASVLETMAKFYKYGVTQQLSLHNHAPAAIRAVASSDIWQRLGTVPVHGAKEIPILIPGAQEGMYTVTTVFDVRDTVAFQNGDVRYTDIPWTYKEEFQSVVNISLNEAADADIAETIRKVSQQHTLDSDTNYPNIVAAAVEYMVRSRLGLEGNTAILSSINMSTIPIGDLLEDINKTAGAVLRTIGNAITEETKRLREAEKEKEHELQRDRDAILWDMGRDEAELHENSRAGGIGGNGTGRDTADVSGTVSGGEGGASTLSGESHQEESGSERGSQSEESQGVRGADQQREASSGRTDASGNQTRGLDSSSPERLDRTFYEEMDRIAAIEDAVRQRQAYFALANSIYMLTDTKLQDMDTYASIIMQHINETLDPVVVTSSEQMAESAIEETLESPDDINIADEEMEISIVNMETSIRDWYIQAYPDDELGSELADITFSELYQGLANSENIYETVQIGDSTVRERLFTELSEISGYDYNHLYELWINSSSVVHTIDEEQQAAEQEDEQNAEIGMAESATTSQEETAETEETAEMAESAISEQYNVVDEAVEENNEHVDKTVDTANTTAISPPALADEDIISLESLDLQADMSNAAGKRAVFMRNLAAIQIVHRLESTGGIPNEQELAVLKAYSGFGGISEAFDAHNHAWMKEYELAQKTLTDSEYASARRSTLSAFYTPPEIIDAIYAGLEHYGFKGGNILDPSTGTGRFLAQIPQAMRENSHLYGVELDELTAKVAKYINTDATIINSGYETARFKENSFDLAISNIPFGNYTVFEDEHYRQGNYLIHDYFPNKMLDNVRPGGLVVCITSKGTMDKKDPSVRKEIARKAELVKAVRLPAGTFNEAGTEVTTDVLIFKKRERELAPDAELPSWVESVEKSNIPLYRNRKTEFPAFNINQYYLENSNDIAGKPALTQNAFGHDFTVLANSPQIDNIAADLKTALVEGVHPLPANAYENQERLPLPKREEPPQERKPFGYYLDDNHELYYINPHGHKDNSVIELIPEKHRASIISLVEIRSHLRNMMDAEMAECSDEHLAAYQAKLKELYDNHVANYGEFSGDVVMKRYFSKDSAQPLLASLEILDDDGKVKALSDVFTKRTIHAYRAPDHAETAQEALMISLQEKGSVDFDYITGLLDMPKEEIINQLEYNGIYEDFTTGKFLPAEEYLSGDIRDKIEELEIQIGKWKLELDREIETSIYPLANTGLQKHMFPDNRSDYSPLEKYAAEIGEYRWSHDDEMDRNLVAPDNRDLLLHKYSRGKGCYTIAADFRRIKSLSPEFAEEVKSPQLFFDMLKAGADVFHPQDISEDFPGWQILNDIRNAMGTRDTGHAQLYFIQQVLNDYADGGNPNVLEKSVIKERYKTFVKNYREPFMDFISEYGSERQKKIAADIERAGKNLSALEAVKPRDLTANEIEINLGATWIPTKDIHEFITEVLCDNHYTDRGVSYSSIANEWHIDNKAYQSISRIANTQRFGTAAMPALDIIEKALNKRSITVRKTVVVDGEEKSIADPKETMLANQKLENIMQEFKNWIARSPGRQKRLVNYYNRYFNNIVPRSFEGAGQNLTFPGMNPEIMLLPHQKDAVAQTMYGGNTLLAHVVGAGKSFEMAASAMESKRIGLCKKSMMVMPGHLTESFGSEFLRLYPDAKILVASPDDFKKGNRQTFFAKITGQDWDAVIMSYEQFSAIPLSIEAQRSFIENELREVYESMAENDGDKWSVKKAEKVREKLKVKLAKLDKLAEKRHDTDSITFEQLGIDRLYVDESHNYKNLDFFTKMQGIQSDGAEKSFDMYSKVRYLNELTGERGVVFASGTPVSNSMAELYTLQRYLKPSRLKGQNISAFDAWASNFGQNVTNMELNPEGKGFRMKTRFSRFYNTPELISMFKEFANVKTADMLNLPVPNVEIETVVAKPTAVQQDMIEDLADRAEMIRAGNPMRIHEGEGKKGLDNMLVITKEGRELALDPRLVDPTAEPPENGKIQMCIDNAARIFRETMADKSTQVIFSDIGTPKTDGSFNVYDMVREGLIAKGVPKDQIVFIHDYKTPEKKEALFKKIRKGDIRIILGSSDKLGIGTNIQDKLIAEHDLDCPWKPSQIEQRKGRIQRRGNENKDVKIYRYVTENTFDTYMWSTCENKQKFISQIMTSRSPSRSAEDVDEVVLDLATTKALCSGSPLIKEKFELDNELTKLKLERAQYNEEHIKLNNQLQTVIPRELKEASLKAENIRHDISVFESNKTPMVLNGHEIPADKIGKTLAYIAKKLYDGELNKTLEGTYRGLRISCTKAPGERPMFNMSGKHKMSFAIVSTDAITNDNRVENIFTNLKATANMYANDLKKIQDEEKAIRNELARPFEKEERFHQVDERMREVDLALATESDNRAIERETRKRNDYIDGKKEPPKNEDVSESVVSKFMSLAKLIKSQTNGQWNEHCDEAVADKMRKLNFPQKVIASTLQHFSPSLPSIDEAMNIAERKQIAACR
jgi:N12 class adenine-specific DNA methylase